MYPMTITLTINNEQELDTLTATLNALKSSITPAAAPVKETPMGNAKGKAASAAQPAVTPVTPAKTDAGSGGDPDGKTVDDCVNLVNDIIAKAPSQRPQIVSLLEKYNAGAGKSGKRSTSFIPTENLDAFYTDASALLP